MEIIKKKHYLWGPSGVMTSDCTISKFWDRISSSQRRNIYKKYGQPVFHISPNVKIIHWALR